MPWSGIAGAAIGAAGSLIGGGISASSARDQMAMQKEFAQNGIRWKVADAKAAGIHPLAALGAQTFSYNPVMVGDYGIGDAFNQMGQGVSRAMEAKQLQSERQLSEELTRANIDKVKAETNFVNQQAAQSAAAVAKTALPPPMPPANAGKMPVPDPRGLFLDKPVVREGFLLDEKGRKVGIVPSDDMATRTEDKLVIEWLPWFGSGVRNFRGKVMGDEVNGHWWHGEDKGYLPYPPKKKRSFRDHVSDVMDFYSTYE